MELKAAAVQSPQKVNAALVSHINRLSQMAARDPSLVPVIRAVQAENGVGERGRADGKDHPKVGVPQEQQRQSESKKHGGMVRSRPSSVNDSAINKALSTASRYR
jgi:hypothetical protein